MLEGAADCSAACRRKPQRFPQSQSSNCDGSSDEGEGRLWCKLESCAKQKAMKTMSSASAV
jgi:hypothetical protein